MTQLLRMLTIAIVLVGLAAAMMHVRYGEWYTFPPAPPPLPSQPPRDWMDVADTIVRPGDIITSEGLLFRYYVAANNTRYVFPVESVHRSWYRATHRIKVVSRAALESLRLVGSVTTRPGSRIVKFSSDPLFYVVDHGGVLYAASDATLRRLYGVGWRERVDTIEDYYRADYRIGTPLGQGARYIPAAAYDSSPTISDDKDLTSNLPRRL